MDTTLFSLETTFKNVGSNIRSLIVLKNSNFAFASGKTIRILDGKTGDLIRTIVNNSTDVYSIAELPNGLLASSGETQIKIWNVTNGKLIRTLNIKISSTIEYNTNLLFVLKNGFLGCVYGDSTIRIWDAIEGLYIRGGIHQIGDSVIVLKNGDLAGSLNKNFYTVNTVGYYYWYKMFPKDNVYVHSLVELQSGDLAYGRQDGLIKILNISDSQNR